TLPNHEIRHVDWRMGVAVAHAAAPEEHRVIEQAALAVRSGLQALEKLSEDPDLPRVDLHQVSDLLRFIAVMRDVVPRLGHAEIREDQLARLTIQHEAEDA